VAGYCHVFCKCRKLCEEAIELSADNNISDEKLLDIIRKLIRDGVTKTDEQTKITNKEYGIEIKPHIVAELKYRDRIKHYWQ
jgi:hypothetical protein